MSALAGFRIVRSSALVGSEKAIRQGDTIYLSPAMYDLLAHAETQAEVRHLLANIKMLTIPELPIDLGLSGLFAPEG